MKDESNVKNVGWTIGTYCNANCSHCYSYKIRQQQNFLTKSEIEKIIERIVESDIETLNLGGNEPIYTNGSNMNETLLPFILEKVTDAGIKVGITTNGVTLNYLYEKFPKIFS